MRARKESVGLDSPGGPVLEGPVAEELRRVLAGMRYGSVTLIVQDGRIVQIDATHKLRLDSHRSSTNRSRP